MILLNEVNVNIASMCKGLLQESKMHHAFKEHLDFLKGNSGCALQVQGCLDT